MPDEILITGGARFVLRVEDKAVSIEEVIKSLRERAAQLGCDGTAIYQQGEYEVVIDLWRYINRDSEGTFSALRAALSRDQADFSIADKRGINPIH